MAPLLKMDQNGKTKRSKGWLWATELEPNVWFGLVKEGSAPVTRQKNQGTKSKSKPTKGYLKRIGQQKTCKLFVCHQHPNAKVESSGTE